MEEKRIIIFGIFWSFLFAFAASAQVVQNGIAVEYNEKAAKTALAGVELRVQRAGSTASDAKGAFALDFPTLKAGDRVAVRRIEKPGYEVFNKEAVEQWNINPSQAFTVVMCRSDKFKALKDRYYANSEERYAGQYRSAKAELERLKKEGKLKEQEYFDRLREVEAEYEKKLDNLDNYVDRFARIDLSELNAEEQAIIDLVQSGQIDEAIERYEKMNITEKLVDGLKKRQEVKGVISTLTETEASLTASTDSLYAMAERQIETLLLAGDSHNNPKIAEIYTTIADADTTNVDWLYCAGVFLRTYTADYDKAETYFRTVLSHAGTGDENPASVLAYCDLSSIFERTGEYAQAMEYARRGLEASNNVFGEEHPLTADANMRIGNVYFRTGENQKALEYYEKAHKIKEEMSACLGNVYLKLGDYPKALEFYEDALAEEKAKGGVDKLEIASIYVNMGSVYRGMNDHPKAMEYYRNVLGIETKILGEEHPSIAETYSNIGLAYADMKEYAKALEYYKKALDIWQKTFGAGHPNIADCYMKAGTVYDNLGDYGQSLACYNTALEIHRKFYGDEHAETALACKRIGLVYCSAENYAEGLRWLKKAYPIFLNAGEEFASEVAFLNGLLGGLYSMAGNLEKSMKHFEHGLPLSEKVNGKEHPQTVEIREMLELVKQEMERRKGLAK